MESEAKFVPDENTIKKAAEIDVFNSKGVGVKFGSIFDKDKTIIVFIRHFFCGACQAYIQALGDIPKEAFEKAGIKLVVIGCGEATGIETYANTTQFWGEIYADPSRKLYNALGMTIETLGKTPEGEERKSYLGNYFLGVARSIWGAVMSPTQLGKQGNIKQLGGDFVFGPGNTCSFASRMQHTEDHVEVSELIAAAGVAYP